MAYFLFFPDFEGTKRNINNKEEITDAIKAEKTFALPILPLPYLLTWSKEPDSPVTKKYANASQHSNVRIIHSCLNASK
jgi:hypothetical protein